MIVRALNSRSSVELVGTTPRIALSLSAIMGNLPAKSEKKAFIIVELSF